MSEDGLNDPGIFDGGDDACNLLDLEALKWQALVKYWAYVMRCYLEGREPIRWRDYIRGATRIAAAKELLDRAYGRAPQAVEHAGKDGGAIKLEDVSQMTDEQLRAELERIWETARGDMDAGR